MMTMSALSAQNFGVTPSNTSAVSAKKHAKHEPAAVAAQPREAAPDTFEAQKTDVTSTTTTATTPEATNSGAFPAVAVAGGAAAGGAVGLASYLTPWTDETETKKIPEVKVDEQGKPIKKDKVAFEADKKIATFNDVTYAVEVDEKGVPTKLGEVKSGVITVGNNKYNYDGKAANIELTPPDNNPYFKEILGEKAHTDQKATLHLLEETKLEVKPHADTKLPALVFTLNDKKELVPDKAITALVADKNHPLTEDTLKAFTKELTDRFNAPKALEDLSSTNKGLATSLETLFETTTKEVTETKGKNGLMIGLVTVGLSALGAAAGFFFGRKKEDPAATTIATSTTTQTAAPTA